MFAAWRRSGAALLARVAAPLACRPLLGSLQAGIAVRWMRVRSSVKKRCEDCYIVRRGKINYVYCKSNGRHKQRQGPKRKQ
jgi:large subunit ribosomal protein L36